MERPLCRFFAKQRVNFAFIVIFAAFWTAGTRLADVLFDHFLSVEIAVIHRIIHIVFNDRVAVDVGL